jgi:hypothetical protein
MTDTDTAAAVRSLTHRISERDEAMRNGADYADAEPFAAEFMAALHGRGWRPTEARLIPIGHPGRPGSGAEPPHEQLADVRAQLDAINSAKREAREASQALAERGRT